MRNIWNIAESWIFGLWMYVVQIHKNTSQCRIWYHARPRKDFYYLALGAKRDSHLQCLAHTNNECSKHKHILIQYICTIDCIRKRAFHRVPLFEFKSEFQVGAAQQAVVVVVEQSFDRSWACRPPTNNTTTKNVSRAFKKKVHFLSFFLYL